MIPNKGVVSLIDNKVSDLWSNIRRGAAGLALGAGLVMFGANAYASPNPYTAFNSQEQQKVEQVDPKTVAYSNAMNAKSIDDKIRLLEQYVTTYNESQYHKYAFKELAFGYYNKKDYDKVILNGDKALGFADLDAESKAPLFLVTGESYVVSPNKKNLDKALDYANRAEQVIKAGGVNQGYIKGVDILKSLIEKARGGVAKPAPKPDPLGAAKSFYNKKDYTNAEKAFASLDQKDPDVAYYHGLSLYQNKKFNESIDRLVAASILAPEKYPKARETAQSIFIANIFKDPATGRGYNSLVKEYNDMAQQDVAKLNKDWNDKWGHLENKEITEEVAAEAEKEKKVLDQRIARINSDILSLQKKLKNAADADFTKLVDVIRQRVGVR
jgi:hypothetical protein